MKKILLILSFLVSPYLHFSQQCGALIEPVSIENRAAEASVIIEGVITSSKSYWDVNRQNIYTVHEIEPYKKFKGTSGSTVQVVNSGGQIEDNIQITSSAARLSKGTTGIFFLKDFKKQLIISGHLYKMVGAVQGIVKYNKFSKKASDMFFKYTSVEKELYSRIENTTHTKYTQLKTLPASTQKLTASGTPIVYSFSPLNATAGTETVLTITGVNFGSTIGSVGFSNANDGGATYTSALDSQILSWSDTEIQVEIPYSAGTGSITVTNASNLNEITTVPLTITYSHLNASNGTVDYPSTLQDDNGSGGFTFAYHTDFNTSTAKTYFEDAFELWNCESEINFIFGSTTTTDVTAADGINVVRFDNGNELATGVLGEVTTRYLGSCGSTNRAIANEIDITWNDSTNWYFGSGNPSASQYDFKTVALHELGHAHQLGHVIDTNLIMHYSLGAGENKYSLGADDVDAAAYAMDVFTQSPGCGATSMSATTLCCDDITINSQPQNADVGQGDTVEFTPSARDYSTVQWYVSTDGGSNFAAISDDSYYSGTNSETLIISDAPLSFDGYHYAAYFTNVCNDTVITNAATLSVTAYTTIPDANFEAALEALGYDNISGDGQVPTENINTVRSLNVSNKAISDLTGIEDFAELETLEVYVNNLTRIDVSDNSFLEHLNVSDNDLTAIDVSNNPDLRILYAGYNQFTTIDVSNNTELTTLYLIHNLLTTIDVTNNILLQDFQFHNNSLTTIDLSANEELDFLSGRDNNLTALDVSNNPLLEKIWCGNNAISSLDISNNPLVTVIQMAGNNLSSLNLQQGNNTNVTSLDVSNNPSLGCILVDDASYSTANWTSIDAQSFFSDTNCNYTSIPDSNFEAALEALGYDDISGDGRVPTSLIENVTSLNVSSSSILDITGIEDFTALESLTASDNALTLVDISNLDNLIYLYIGNNSLTAIDVSENVLLEELGASYNSLTAIDVSANTALKKLHVRNNSITIIDVSNNTALKEIGFQYNSLTTIDLSNNGQLNTISGRNNNLTALDLSNNPLLTTLWCVNNNITTLDLTNNPLITTIHVRSNNLSYANVKNGNNTSVTTFNLGNNPNLTCVIVDDASYSTANWTGIDATVSFTDTNYCVYTAIPDANFEAALEALGYDDISGDGQVPTALIENVTRLQIGENSIADVTGLEDFTALTELELYQIGLLSIDVSNNTLLEKVSLNNNPLTRIDVSTLTNLTTLEIAGTDLTNVDVSTNTSLVVMDVSNNNSLSALNVRNGNNTNITTFNATNNTALSCILVDDEAYSTANWSANIDSQASFTATNYCGYTAIPDANFEAALEALGYDDISGDGQVPTTLIEGVSSLNISGESIADLTGIEAFTALNVFYCENNMLTSVDLSTLTNLTYVSLIQNALSSLDVSALTNLQILECDGNNLTTLDLSNNINLDTLGASYNNLVSLNIQNGNNTRIGLEEFQVQNNDDLTCILVDDASYSNSTWTDIDTQMFFNETHCNYTAIPDSNFEAALEVLGYDDISGDGQVPTHNISNITILSIFSKSISDLTGIEDFTALESLDCRSNSIAILDLSNNTALTTVNSQSNSLTAIDVSNSVNLTSLKIGNNNTLERLDVSNNTQLQTLECYSTAITSLDISNNTALRNVLVFNTNLSSLDTSNHADLEKLECYSTSITHVDVTNSPSLETLHVGGLGLAEIDLSNNTLLSELRLNENEFTALDLSSHNALEIVALQGNNLAYLNINNGNNTSITQFNITENANLTCVLVDDVAYSETNWVNKDDQTSYNETLCDTTNPTVVCKDITVQLDQTGNASITAQDIDNGSTDDVAIASMYIDNAVFNCTSIGTVIVTLTVTDVAGNSDSCSASVTIQDSINPVFETATLPVDQDVTSNNAADATYTLADFTTEAIATDNCSNVLISQSPIAGTALPEGDHEISITATDTSGNETAHAFTITVNNVLSISDGVIKGLRMYPNPTKGKVYFTLPIEKIELYNVTGQKVLKTSGMELNLTNMPSGVYFAYLSTKNGADVYRIVRD